MNAKQRKHTSCTVNPTDSGLRAQVPRCASTYLVSHNWESENHPDNDEGTKLKWLQNIKAHLRIQDEGEIWIWLDFFSIPRKNRFDQHKATMSLPHYTQLCTSILPLVRDARRWTELYDKQPSGFVTDLGFTARGDINTYYKRGWYQPETKVPFHLKCGISTNATRLTRKRAASK